MKKAVLWLRTSTDRQEIESMKAELIDLAAKYDYERDACVYVGAQGASAIKADEVYTEEVEKLYSLLGTGEYDCVFAWELSRLGRREDYVISLKNYLIEHHIQLRIAKPTLYLLEDDGSVNAGMELAITLLTTLAKQEMSIKKERMSRGRRRNQREGKFAGAPCLRWGYKLDENGYIAIDEVKAHWVRHIFSTYLHTDASVNSIYKELNQLGVMPDYKSIFTGGHRVLMMLKSYAYAGIPDRGHIYPAIVPKSMVDRAIAKAHERNKDKSLHRHHGYCKSIITCEDCGHIMAQQVGSAEYKCKNHGHTACLSMNVMDYIAWRECAGIMAAAQLINRDDELRKHVVESDRQRSIIIEARNKLKSLEVKVDRANELYIEGKLSKASLEAKLKNLAQERKKLQACIVDHQQRLDATERLREAVNEGRCEVSEVTDDELRVKYIKQSLRIRVRSAGVKGSYLVKVVPTSVGAEAEYIYKVRGHKIHLFKVMGDGSHEDLTEQWPVKWVRKRKVK